ncbi:MAG: Gp15 family bacteriophage protein [Lentihominibacter sp.]|uniref:Gp15 family bacteriophage protein n=1 Tax=Lentihominibacter sp. TaxID=2944216 RepID=UPI002A9196A2|nr:Gp15 family bacteriophage protein [Lentihominibacter sp.]MDY5287598.1 Gp15 family bacteriophage protein [Lentihominibacter sp.]
MLDLRTKGLPNAIAAHGQAFLLNTDFRVWLDYPRLFTEDLGSLFADRAPVLTPEVADQLDLFYNPPKKVPRATGSGAPVVDWEIDADLIYAAFRQAYGIDLLTTDLHWHEFKALFDALPDDTLMVRVIQWRSYKGSDKDILELKNAWALPEKLTEAEQQAVDEFNELFG